MHLDQNVAKLADRLVSDTRLQRNESMRETLQRNQNAAVKRGTLGAGFYVMEQQEACIRELEGRAEAVWGAYRRAIEGARIGWSSELQAELIDRVRAEVEGDVGYIEDMARAVIAQHGHSFGLFLRDAWPGILDRISAEIELFGLHRQPVVTPTSVLLSAPRYAGPAGHWERAQSALGEEPPDLIEAAREAVHTIEATAKVLVNDSSATLGECIKRLRAAGVLPSPVVKQLGALWGYSSNLDGVRHGSSSGTLPTDPELLYVIDSSEAAIKLLLRLDRAAG